MLITMSISRAPQRIASRASYALAEGSAAPSGKPTTAIGTVLLPERIRAAVPTWTLFTQTVAKPWVRASSASLITSSRVASGLSRVWSMNGAMSAEVRIRSGESRAAPSFTAVTVPQASEFVQTVQLDAHDAATGSSPPREASWRGSGAFAVHGCSVPARNAWIRRRTRSAISSTT